MTGIQRTPLRQTQPMQRPLNLPKPQIRKYVPPATQDNSNFDDRGSKWIRPEALQHYDSMVVQSTNHAFAWLPMPMFNSQDPSVFCDTRYAGDESQFDEWSYCTSMVRMAGTTRKITFCPYSDNPSSSDTFITSPYVVLRDFIANMDKEREISRASPWYLLLKFDEGKGYGNYLPKARRYYLMLSVLLHSVKNMPIPDSKQYRDVATCHYNPNTLGKGLGQGEKLTVLAISQQIWNDITQAMNGRSPDGNWVYPNPCDPGQLAVFYAWNHKKSSCPIPGVTAKKDISGMSGAVSGVLHELYGEIIAGNL